MPDMSNEPRASAVAEPPAETEAKAAASEARAARAGRDAAGERKHVPGPPRSVWREYFESLVVTAIMAFFGMTFVVQAVKVPTGSMQNTIVIGDHLLVNKFIFAPGATLPFLPQREIRRGDIIVFKYPGSQTSHRDPPNDPTNKQYVTNYVKRVIGLPGDRIQLRGTQVIVNGERLPERVVTAKVYHDDDPRTPGVVDQNAPLVPEASPPPEGEGPYTVYYRAEARRDPDELFDEGTYNVYELSPEKGVIIVPTDSYFVMGDSRDNSLDSRYWGFVPRDLIIGRAMFVYWSYDESAPSGGFPFIQDFFANTRWSRTGTMVK
jgi:signal peptidase I